MTLGECRNVIDNTTYTLNHLVDAADNLQVSLGEAYARNQIACHWHLGIYIREKGHLHNLCADFQALRPSVPLPGIVGERVSGFNFHRKMELVGLGQQGCENPVLIRVGEVAEDSEGVRVGVWSTVRLRVTDDCPLRGRDFAEMYPLVREPLATILNRELNLPGFPVGLGNPDMVTVKLPEKIIQRTSEVVNNVSNNNADLQAPRLWDCCDAEHMMSGFKVELGTHLDKFGFGDEYGRDYFLQSFAMLARPLDFGAALSEVDCHGVDSE